MPVVNVTNERLVGDRKPAWSSLTAGGIFRVPRIGGRFDRHYHDCDEYWLIYRGRALVMSEGVEYVVGPGDVVCTEIGQEHDVIAVDEDLEGFFLETQVIPGGRIGHLHRSPELRDGHDVEPRDLG